MSINVLASTIVIASISYAQPIYEAQYIEPVVQANYTEVVTQTSYTEVQVLVELSIAGRIEVDVITPTDLVSLGINKGFNDSLGGFTDTFLKVFNKQPQDTLTSSEQITSRAIEKALSDIQAVAEAKQITLVKAILDTTTPIELAKLQSIKALADTVGASIEQTSRDFYKALSDSTTLTDALASFVEHSRAENISLTDISSLNTGKDGNSDETFVSDIPSLGQNKALNEELIPTDSISFQLRRNIILSLAEVIYHAEEQKFDITTQKADNMTVSSNGLLIMQNYCDITYFLEDYVGISRTFT